MPNHVYGTVADLSTRWAGRSVRWVRDQVAAGEAAGRIRAARGRTGRLRLVHIADFEAYLLGARR
ncbi:MAG TPA: hypothetical protein VNA25_02470 [Phycisphaerae bacterium]|nr:hypothetical protein [Phycisphaerae bacterium]